VIETGITGITGLPPPCPWAFALIDPPKIMVIKLNMRMNAKANDSALDKLNLKNLGDALLRAVTGFRS
jgi:hypothetical protein